jgi:hypothetical protein
MKRRLGIFIATITMGVGALLSGSASPAKADGGCGYDSYFSGWERQHAGHIDEAVYVLNHQGVICDYYWHHWY